MGENACVCVCGVQDKNGFRLWEGAMNKILHAKTLILYDARISCTCTSMEVGSSLVWKM